MWEMGYKEVFALLHGCSNDHSRYFCETDQSKCLIFTCRGNRIIFHIFQVKELVQKVYRKALEDHKLCRPESAIFVCNKWDEVYIYKSML